MAEMDQDRQRALEDLVLRRRPTAEAAGRLRAFEWDSEIEYVILSRRDVSRLLEEFVDGRLDAAAVSEWANAIECRDDIGFEAGWEAELKDFIFTTANPELNGVITVDDAIRWKAALHS